MKSTLILSIFYFLYIGQASANDSLRCSYNVATELERGLGLGKYVCPVYSKGKKNKSKIEIPKTILGPFHKHDAIVSGEIVCFVIDEKTAFRWAGNKISHYKFKQMNTYDRVYCEKISTLSNEIDELKDYLFNKKSNNKKLSELIHKFPLLGDENSETLKNIVIPRIKEDFKSINDIVETHKKLISKENQKLLIVNRLKSLSTKKIPFYSYNPFGATALSKFGLIDEEYLENELAAPSTENLKSYSRILSSSVKSHLEAAEFILKNRSRPALAQFHQNILDKSIKLDTPLKELFVYKERLCLYDSKWVFHCINNDEKEFKVLAKGSRVRQLAVFNDRLCYTGLRPVNQFANFSMYGESNLTLKKTLTEKINKLDDIKSPAKLILNCLDEKKSLFKALVIEDKEFTKKISSKALEKMSPLNFKYSDIDKSFLLPKNQRSGVKYFLLSTSLPDGVLFYNKGDEYCIEPSAKFTITVKPPTKAKYTSNENNRTVYGSLLGKETCASSLEQLSLDMSFHKKPYQEEMKRYYVPFHNKRLTFNYGVSEILPRLRKNKATYCSVNSQDTCCFGHSIKNEACYVKDLEAEIAISEIANANQPQTFVGEEVRNNFALKELARVCLIEDEALDEKLCESLMPLSLIGLKSMMLDKRIKIQNRIVSELYSKAIQSRPENSAQLFSVLFQKINMLVSLTTMRDELALSQYSMLGGFVDTSVDSFLPRVIIPPYAIKEHKTPHVALYASDFMRPRVRSLYSNSFQNYFSRITSKRIDVLRQSASNITLLKKNIKKVKSNIKKTETIERSLVK